MANTHGFGDAPAAVGPNGADTTDIYVALAITPDTPTVRLPVPLLPMPVQATSVGGAAGQPDSVGNGSDLLDLVLMALDEAPKIEPVDTSGFPNGQRHDLPTYAGLFHLTDASDDGGSAFANVVAAVGGVGSPADIGDFWVDAAGTEFIL